jgi:hypothetical protein
MRKLILLTLFAFIVQLYGQLPNGSRSLIFTQTARTFEKGRLEVHSNMNFFTKVTDFVGQGTKPLDFSAVNYWLVNGNLAITYGITDHFDFTVAPQIYQDTHAENEYNLPGDIFLLFKAGSFAFGDRHMYGSGLIGVRLPTGEEHNYPFTEYASGAVEYGIGSALSYYKDQYLPDRSLNAHLNLNWWNHNEAGRVVYKTSTFESKSTKNSSELQVGLAAVYPTQLFDYRMELNGVFYLNEPDEFVYSRESWMYLTPSLRYNALSWMSLDFGVSVRVSPDEETTNVSAAVGREEQDLPNYAAWKAQIGLNFKILPFTVSHQTSAEVQRDEFKKRVDFFQQIVEDREKSAQIQEELDKLKEERETAEKELEELKQILQEEGE